MTKGDIKKEIILNEAAKIFAQYGLAKTTVDDIASASRMGKASLYHYFPGKEEIYRQVVERENVCLKEKVKQLMDRESSPQSKIKVYIVNGLKYLARFRNLRSALKDKSLDHYQFIKDIRSKFFHNEVETVREILEQGMKSGAFKKMDTKFTSFVVAVTLKGLLEHPRSVSASQSEKEKYIDKLADLLFDGITER